MAMIRCPHCNMALTNDESRASACAVCGESLGSVATAVTSRLPEYRSCRTTVRRGEPLVRKNLGFLPLFGILFAGGVTFAIFTAALNGFRSGGAGSAGTAAGVTITYFILYGMGLVGNKKS